MWPSQQSSTKEFSSLKNGLSSTIRYLGVFDPSPDGVAAAGVTGELSLLPVKERTKRLPCLGFKSCAISVTIINATRLTQTSFIINQIEGLAFLQLLESVLMEQSRLCSGVFANESSFFSFSSIEIFENKTIKRLYSLHFLLRYINIQNKHSCVFIMLSYLCYPMTWCHSQMC